MADYSSAIKETQGHLLELMKELDALCTEHGLKYYLGGGCLVGAMRNKGFLPWDDDADIHMTRKDAYKLLDLYHQGAFPKDRAITSYEDFEPCAELHWRYVDTSRTAMLRSTIQTHTPQGQFVDIFILNPAPTSEKAKLRYTEDFDLYWDLYVPFVCTSKRTDRVIDRYNLWRHIAKIVGQKRINKYFRKKLYWLPDDESPEVAIQAVRAPQPYWDRSLFQEGRRVPFEDTTVMVAKYAEEMLAHAYGADWVLVPQLAAREEHVMIVDNDIPYTYYARDFEAIEDIEQTRVNTRAHKDAYYRGLKMRNYVNSTTALARITLRAMKIDGEFSQARPELEKFLAQGNYTALRQFFKEFNAVQAQESTSFWRLLVPVSDDCLWFALAADFMEGAFTRPLKLLRIRVDQIDTPLSPQLATMLEVCEKLYDAMYALWTKHDHDKAAAISQGLLEMGDTSSGTYRLHLETLMLDGLTRQKALAPQELAELDRLTSTYLTAYPSDGELNYWRGEVLRLRGLKNEALPHYQEACHWLSNGILLTRCNETLRDEYGVS